MIHQWIHLKERFPFLGEDGKDPTLRLYLPFNMTEMNRQDDMRPAVLVCPGGGYGMCSQREAEVVALQFVSWGYNAYVLDYSVSPHCFPSQIREVAACMELIAENAKAWNTDPQRVAIMGFSAGGHLAGHYSTCYDIPEVREVFPESKKVKASILCYPVITSDPHYSHEGSFHNLSGHRILTEEDRRQFGLETKIGPDTPPAFLWHTAADDLVPVMNSILYAQKLAEHNVPFALHIFTHGWHGMSTCDEQTNGPLPENMVENAEWMQRLRKWLKYNL